MREEGGRAAHVQHVAQGGQPGGQVAEHGQQVQACSHVGLRRDASQGHVLGQRIRRRCRLVCCILCAPPHSAGQVPSFPAASESVVLTEAVMLQPVMHPYSMRKLWEALLWAAGSPEVPGGGRRGGSSAIWQAMRCFGSACISLCASACISRGREALCRRQSVCRTQFCNSQQCSYVNSLDCLHQRCLCAVLDYANAAGWDHEFKGAWAPQC